MTTMFNTTTLTFFSNLNHTTFMHLDFFVPIVFTLLGLILITRQIDDWKVLFLPVFIGLTTIGFHTTNAMYAILITIGAILMVTSSLSVETVGSAISTTARAFTQRRQTRKNVLNKYHMEKFGTREPTKNMIAQQILTESMAKAKKYNFPVEEHPNMARYKKLKEEIAKDLEYERQLKEMKKKKQPKQEITNQYDKSKLVEI